MHEVTQFTGQFATELIHSRRTVLPKRLVAPGPQGEQLQRILEAASAAPDHGELVPWRFVLVGEPMRAALGDAFAAALHERDPAAEQQQQEEAREKAFRSPVLLLAVARTSGGDESIPAFERIVSAGCAIQNMLLMATALGFGSALTSGKALESRALRELFQLSGEEHALCFLSFGTVGSTRKPRARPAVDQYVSELQ
ncbi:MAG: nitroreductase [Burkholderiales bacterium]|nr:nitroreductase [Burkholderiales bacterium]